jgi:hypothetical protein
MDVVDPIARRDAGCRAGSPAFRLHLQAPAGAAGDSRAAVDRAPPPVFRLNLLAAAPASRRAGRARGMAGAGADRLS